jgi:hypothetical protein
MDLKLAAHLVEAAFVTAAAALVLVVRFATNVTLFQKIVAQYRSRMWAGILCLTCFAGGTLFGEYALSSKTKGEIEKVRRDYQANRDWALRAEEEKNFLLQALNQAPVLQREYDNRCARPQAACVLLYSDKNSGGRWLALPIGEYPDLRMLGFNDTARSIKISRDVHALVFADVNYQGHALPINGNAASLGADFDQAISSVQVVSGKAP